METKTLLIALTGLIVGLALFITGCSSNDDVVTEAQAVTEDIIDHIIKDSLVGPDNDSPKVKYANDVVDEKTVVFPNDDINRSNTPVMLDILTKDQYIYTLLPNGVVIHDVVNGNNNFIQSEKPLGAMIKIGEKILIGGDNLYTLEDGFLSAEDFDLDLSGSITALAQQGPFLYVGTSEAIYKIYDKGVKEMATGVSVSAIAPGLNGIWIGTSGDGLYHWKDNHFRKRFLRRDSTLFDNVTALEYRHNHLYLGTDNGLFVYDGGSWNPYGLGDGLPSEVITAINADEWVVKIGTANGAVTFFNNEFKLITKFEGLMVNCIAKQKQNLIAATSKGLLMKSGGLITTLFDGLLPAETVALKETF